jgi:hypothetical protein
MATAPDQRQFLAFASELTKTIGRLGVLEGTLIALEKKHGQLLHLEDAAELCRGVVKEMLALMGQFVTDAVGSIKAREIEAHGESKMDSLTIEDDLIVMVNDLRRLSADVLANQ